ncbi:MAG: SDR family NAD(P)-dependent oxidoreductase [Candidatus Eisenbacteria bacterium]|nr:SDR family NAD(P)-dependent oxidoreductase [Candidatus Eisenbacteria bacterium]
MPRALKGKVAVVTGASRGAGRGIAIELGAAGATVYVTGRSVAGSPAGGYERFLEHAHLQSMPGTIDETAEQVTRNGGSGIPVRCDHTSPEGVAALFRRIDEESGRLDLLVNNAWGAHRNPIEIRPFWEDTMDHWEGMFQRGLRNHILASRSATPIFLRQRSGLIVTTTFWDRDRYTGHLFYDLAKASMVRLALGMARELRPYGVASIALSPGWMRTELVLASFRTDEEHWREVPALSATESPRYVGRAVVALLADPDVLAKTGGVFRTGDLAKEYGFTDVDGRQVPPFEVPE